MTATTTETFCQTAEVIANASFRVQVVGIDPDGQGPHYTSYQSAIEYATCANANGFDCFLHLA